ncbi:hypothetical protein [Bacillus pumilus]|nr:hypothetical protein [Bacillus pumilus]
MKREERKWGGGLGLGEFREVSVKSIRKGEEIGGVKEEKRKYLRGNEM